jgi:NAD(P)-dependent dehydrogenase (short-subunit alcohol dehydrogenase family)
VLRAVEPFLGAPASAQPEFAAPAPPEAFVAADATAELIRVVAERTGYPPDMLDLAADLEADLGVDSIKRVEILAAFRRAVLPDMKEASRAFVDALGSARTMQAMLDGLVRFLEPSFAAPAAPAAPAVAAASAASTVRTPRCVVRAVDLPAEGTAATLPVGGVVLVTDDGGGAATAVAETLRAQGAKVVVVPLESLDTRERLGAAVEAARREGTIAGAVHLAPSTESPAFAIWPPAAGGLAGSDWLRAERTELQGLLFLAQALAPELGASVEGSFLFAAVTRGGGDFGPLSEDASTFWRGGIAGFMKCAALEWPSARIRAVDLAGVSDAEIGDTLLREWSEAGPVEVGYRQNRRVGLQAVEAPLHGFPEEPQVRLDDQSVVLVTGGARGITAEVVKELAERSRATFVLVARTPLPEGEEPAELASARSAKDLRMVIASAMRAQQRKVSPKDVEARVQAVLRAREVRDTLRALRAAGARVEYVPCDVADAAAFGSVVAEVAARYGRIDALIHGAGAIEDKLIVDKTAASFQRVLRTKVDPLLTLIGTVPRGSLKLLIVFSSVAGFFGNRGQADYAAANEVLNRLAELIRRHWGIKVMSLNWGPWEGTGMVTDEVAEQFKSKGIDLVTIDQGRRAVWDEICQPPGADVRILLGPGPWVVRPGRTAVPAAAPGAAPPRVLSSLPPASA